MRKMSILFTLVFAVGCGIEIPKEDQTKKDESKISTATVDNPSETGTGSEKIDDSTTLTAKDKWRFDGREMTFQEAVDEAPEGWRLPTRVELVEAFDNSEFKWEQSYDITVWASTTYIHSDGDVAWVMSMQLGTFYQENKQNKDPVIYINKNYKKSAASQSQQTSQSQTTNQGGVTVINNNTCINNNSNNNYNENENAY